MVLSLAMQGVVMKRNGAVEGGLIRPGRWFLRVGRLFGRSLCPFGILGRYVVCGERHDTSLELPY